ncbi:MAG: MATE family efflux transporter [Clostridia bacterium]|nr:MATE family efflux transporter [Clostridia bacterium]
MDNSKAADKQYKLMTQTPVAKLVSALAAPTVISMMVTMIYNAADTFFVSKINISASGATSIVFTLMGVIQACGFTFGHGAGSNISRQLGAKDFEEAKKYSSTAFFLALFTGAVIGVLGLVFLTPFMKFLGSTDTILPYAKDYARFILIAAPAFVASCVLNNILRYEGMARLAMVGLTTGGILNMALDPLFIFVFKLGASGAGLATAISQYISLGILFSVFLKKKTQSRISFKYFSFNFQLIKNIILTGLPSFARQSLNSVSTMVLNITAKPFGDPCIAALGIVSKCAMLVFSVAVGIGQGFQPVCSFNYGAKKYSRVRESIFFTLKLDSVVVASFSALIFVFAPKIIGLFRKEDEIIGIGAPALRYLCVALVVLPIIMIANMTFQSIGKTGRAFFLACSQNGLFYIPLIVILNKLMGLIGLELAQPIAYLIAACVSLPFLLAFTKQLKISPDGE